jgi:tripartite-type tricarboxylate transporter receptor subunit TctC
MRLAAAFFVTTSLSSVPLHAQTYPERAVTMVVPFPAGGATDPVSRAVAQRMSEAWGQPVVVVNRPGAAGSVGAEAVLRAPPDGYMLLIGTTAFAISPAIYPKMSYDVLADLAPVSQLVITPNVLTVHPSVPARSVRELIAVARAQPGVLRSASAGTGSSNHLALVLFRMQAGIDIRHIPYKGAAPALTDTVGGHVDMTFVPSVGAVPLVQAGRLRALGVTSVARSPALPQVPTIHEAGLPGYEASSWVSLFVHAATPRPIVTRIHATVTEALRSPGVAAMLVRSGAEPIGNTPDEFAKVLRAEIAKWARVVRASGERLE